MKLSTAFLLGCLITAAPLHAQTYTVTDLGVLPGGLSSTANAINRSGIVVGVADTADSTHAVQFSSNGQNNLDLGTLGGATSGARAINVAGIGVGYAFSAASPIDGSVKDDATRFSRNGTVATNTDLGSLGYTISAAFAINDSGTIVGYAFTTLGLANHATLFSGTGVNNIDLGTLGGNDSIANGINNSGTIVGEASVKDDNVNHALVYHAAIFNRNGQPNIDLGTLGGNNSTANAINDSGTIVGKSSTHIVDTTLDQLQHAALFGRNGEPNIDLGTLGGAISAAYAVNNSGVVVGFAKTTGDAASHAFVYRDGTMIDLNILIPANSGIVLTEARGINDAGQIAANGTVNDLSHALRLDPVTSPPPPIVTFLIIAKASPKSKGTVTGAGTYPSGTTVTLKAKPKSGKTFVNWKDGKKIVGKKKKLVIVLTANRTITANFQ